MDTANAKKESVDTNFIPNEALRASEQLRNPKHIDREKTPTLVANPSPKGDPFTEESVSPDQPTLREAKTEEPDTKVKGG